MCDYSERTIDLGHNCKMIPADTDNSVQYFEQYIGDIGWRYEDFAVRKIATENYYVKEQINALLRHHPNWVEEMKAVVLTAEFSRKADLQVASLFSRWLFRRARAVAEAKGVSTYLMDDIIFYLTEEYTQFMEDNYSTKRLETCFASESGEKLGLQKLHVHAGQKRSRIVGKFCKMLGIDKDAEYKAQYDKYCEAINPLKIPRPVIISTNFNDFVRMSDGAGDRPWRSCHNPDKSAYEGCNCSGGISHALDTTSIIMYTVSDASKTPFATAKKVDRCVFFAGRNSEGEIAWFVQSKVYPDGTEQKSEEFRTIFQKVLSECMGIHNLWVKGKIGDSWASIWNGDYSTAYPDFDYQDRNLIVPFYPSGADTSLFEGIEVGAEPICVECGEGHDYKDQINCCHHFNAWGCPHCSTVYENSEDHQYYSEFHGEYGCDECMRWCSFADDYFYNDEEWAYVKNIDEEIPVEYMEHYNRKFAQCEECGDWLYISDGYVYHNDGFYTDADGNVFCNDCAEEVLTYCEDCGEYYRTEDMVEINGEYYCESCAEKHDDWRPVDDSAEEPRTPDFGMDENLRDYAAAEVCEPIAKELFIA